MASQALPDPGGRAAVSDDIWPGERLSPLLAQAAAGLDERFVRGGDLLAAAIETIQGLLAGLDAMNHALDADAAAAAVAQLHCVAAQIAQLPATLRQRDTNLIEVADVVRQLEGYIVDIKRQLQIIGIYGMNIKIAGAGGDFRIFVDDMGGRLQTGEDEIAVFAGRLIEMQQSVAPVRKAYAQVLSAQSGLSSDIHQQIGACGARLERHLADGTQMAEKLAGLARRVHDAVGGVLAAIQVADSTRQRIEHVVTTLDRVGEADRAAQVPAGARQHMARLIASQIEAAMRDHTDQARELSLSLERLASASSDLARLIDQGVAGGGPASLHELETGIAVISAMTTRMGETATSADAMVGCIEDAITDLTRRLDSIDQLVRDVKEIAINTRLLCLRQGQTGVAVAVIAVEVAAQARQLKETAAAILTAIRRLATLNQELHSDDGAGHGDLGAILEQARGVIATACTQSDAALADGAARVRRLIAQIGDAGAVVGDDDRLGQQMDAAAAALAWPVAALDAADEAWLRRVLPEIGALYTMAAERAVHTRFVLPGMHAAAVTSAAVEQDEDGLF